MKKLPTNGFVESQLPQLERFKGQEIAIFSDGTYKAPEGFSDEVLSSQIAEIAKAHGSGVFTILGEDPAPEKNPWSKDHFNLTEQGRITRDNPDLAKSLREASR